MSVLLQSLQGQASCTCLITTVQVGHVGIASSLGRTGLSSQGQVLPVFSYQILGYLFIGQRYPKLNNNSLNSKTLKDNLYVLDIQLTGLTHIRDSNGEECPPD